MKRRNPNAPAPASEQDGRATKAPFPHQGAPVAPARRRLLGAAAGTLALGLAGWALRTPATAPRPAGQAQRLRLIGEATLPHNLSFRATTVGGLSALDFDPESGLWVALSDDRSQRQPARFYTLRLALTAQRLGQPELLDAVTLRQADGRPFPERAQDGEVVDPEGLRLLPGGRGILWTSEGNVRSGLPPALREAGLDGRERRIFRLPPHLLPDDRDGLGPRNNATLEGLCLTPDGHGAWAAMEGALLQDGPKPTPEAPGGPCRFTLFDLAGGEPLRQLAYVPDALPARSLLPGGLGASNGVSAILMADAHRMLVLERSYVLGSGVSLRLYEIDVREGSDCLALPQLVPGTFRAPPKRLVADFAALALSRVDNGEGMCWGPPLAGGRRTLVFVSDNNFNPAQVTQFAAFEFLE